MLFLHSFSGSARVSCIVSLDIVWCLECSKSSHLKVNKSLRKSTRKISFPCMTLRSVLANLMLVSGTCISGDEQRFPDPAEKERGCFEDLEYSYLPDQASEYRKSVIFILNNLSAFLFIIRIIRVFTLWFYVVDDLINKTESSLFKIGVLNEFKKTLLLVLSYNVSATSVCIRTIEFIVYKEIAGGPIFDLYDDDGWIQYNDNKIAAMRASTHNRNDEHMDIPSSTLMLITWVKAKGEQNYI
ncbi:BnaA09g20910D [Brassica napus]|uniref:(rape) hypothetical protein n=1 Tax=Brassica napus TaxID=3708 RepID=A0A078FWA2_BRANA|nr:unnamed protein product [Brassica napus]CDY16713.1 BnaA09g20910D [Brassica napus]